MFIVDLSWEINKKKDRKRNRVECKKSQNKKSTGTQKSRRETDKKDGRQRGKEKKKREKYSYGMPKYIFCKRTKISA